MTREEFLAALAKTKGEWRIKQDSRAWWSLLRTGVGQCPITRLAGVPGVDHWEASAAVLGLSPEDARFIVCAADGGRGTAEIARFRNDMLRACGLEEEPLDE